MDDKKKQLNQIIILTVLLVGLGISISVMVKSMSGSRPQGQAAGNADADAQAAAAPTGPTSRVTPMGALVTGGTVDDSEFTEQGFVGSLNTNVFRVYDINAQRNPFQPESSWFSDELENIPGSSLPDNFLNEMSESVPDLNKLFNTDQEFVAYSMEKRMAPENFTFDGFSEDGRIETNITASVKSEPTIRVEYSEKSGTEVEEIAQREAADANSEDYLPFGTTPFGTEQSTAGPSPNTIRAPRNGEADQPLITCSGVSIKGDNRSALLQMPDGSRLVREGDVLMPGNLKVVKISELGVEIRDIRTAEQVLVPLSSSV
ncbi:hypothetical protein KDL29_16190 [bacterium]|nr:hypothetical protein [bacterium]UNM08581.1 MAG: hypothetical protein H7A35_00695 [Planctomycetales bacterium]